MQTHLFSSNLLALNLSFALTNARIERANGLEAASFSSSALLLYPPGILHTHDMNIC